ncbi:transporter substrate-binding domain-containing protein [Pseudactinotalea suaedae]|uniref:transporter substrate-binding domain-containing protein n=1 Tax=Pseudactinotalea suaedae TaxID=1524924 RepID=UPI001F4FAE0E|nr:transporter substrate-binding domain-containing protein [Pseudactinotalea suaedae]
MSRRRAITGAAAAVLMWSAAACSFPQDPDGTLKRVTGGVLRVGVSENPPFTRWPGGAPEAGESGEPSGTEVELVSAFAASLDAEVAWVPGSEADLMTRLEESELDVVIAGLQATTPWSSHAAITYPYATSIDDKGEEVRHVMAVAMGENGLLTTLESFLLAQDLAP